MGDPLLTADSWSLLIASWINIVLYAAEFLLCVYYFIESSKRKTKWVMVVLLFIDSVCTAMVCCNVYFSLIRYNGEGSLAYYSHLDWTMPITVTTTFLSAMLEQGYFTYRYWAISRNWIVTSSIVLPIIALPVYSMISSIFLSLLKDNARKLGFDSIITSSVIATFTDITLACVTVWKLKAIKTVRDTTRSLVWRVSTYSVIYGASTSVMTVLLLVMYFVSDNGYIVIFFCLGRVYSLTVFLNLILLREWRSIAFADTTIPSDHSSPLNQIDFGNLCPGRSSTGLSRETRTMVVEPLKRPVPAPAFSMDMI